MNSYFNIKFKHQRLMLIDYFVTNVIIHYSRPTRLSFFFDLNKHLRYHQNKNIS